MSADPLGEQVTAAAGFERNIIARVRALETALERIRVQRPTIPTSASVPTHDAQVGELCLDLSDSRLYAMTDSGWKYAALS